MPTTSTTTTHKTIKKQIVKKPKKGSVEAVLKAFEEARKAGLDLSYLKP